MDKNKNYYDKDYYKSHCGQEYERGCGWEEIFGSYADRIVKEINPQKTLDVGCARGFFVEALRDRGVKAYGIDISDYAISQVREDIKPFCKVKSALLPIEEKYDLITCIEVLEHLDGKDIPMAIQRMCEASDDIIFSSTPFDYEEESHISIHAPEYWAEQFAYHGFYHDVQYDCSYIAVQTMRFRKMEKSKIELIREYEKTFFQKNQETLAARHRVQISTEKIEIYKEAYQKHVDIINEELNPQIEELKKQNLKLQEELKIEKEKLAEKILKEAEAHCRLQFEQEIVKRKELEEKYYINKEKLEIAEQEEKNILSDLKQTKRELGEKITELEQVRLTVLNLQYKLWSGASDKSITELKKEKYEKKKLQKNLLKKDMEYWKPVFDAQYYAKQNRDIYEICGNDAKALLKHFICYGMQEGRTANPLFDINVYMSCNPDVAEATNYDRRECYLHYIAYGQSEGRKAK